MRRRFADASRAAGEGERPHRRHHRRRCPPSAPAVAATTDGLHRHGRRPRCAAATVHSPVGPPHRHGRGGRRPGRRGDDDDRRVGSGSDQLPGVRARSGDTVPVIAIDGPVGSGKSTVAKAVAARLDLPYMESGAMYRVVALAGVRRGLDPEAEGAAETYTDLAAGIDMEVGDRVLLDGDDVTGDLRSKEVGPGRERGGGHGGRPRRAGAPPAGVGRRARRGRDRGPRHRQRRLPRRRREDLPHGQRRGAGPAARPRRDGRRPGPARSASTPPGPSRR